MNKKKLAEIAVFWLGFFVLAAFLGGYFLIAYALAVYIADWACVLFVLGTLFMLINLHMYYD